MISTTRGEKPERFMVETGMAHRAISMCVYRKTRCANYGEAGAIHRYMWIANTPTLHTGRMVSSH